MNVATLTSNPFPGLRAFEPSERDLFFGRDAQRDDILRRLQEGRFLAVVGTSGSGKSSLIRASVLPSLQDEKLPGGGYRWGIAVLKPGGTPVANLAAALLQTGFFEALHDRESKSLGLLFLENTLRRSGLGLVEAVRQSTLDRGQRLLVIVDQMEELFRFTQPDGQKQEENEAAALVKLLMEAANQTEKPIYVLITMRSDYIGDCAKFRDLPEAVNDGLYLIPRMTRGQQAEAITGPVEARGAEIAARLVNRLLNDVGDDPKQLPIFQHALMRTWDAWARTHADSEPLDLDHYGSIGGMQNALSNHANEAFEELPDDRHREIANRVFRCLTEKGPDNRESRRPVNISTLAAVTGVEQADVLTAIESFRQPGTSFLLPPSRVPVGGNDIIDISHESLISGWDKLKEWVEAESRSAWEYRRLADTAMRNKAGKADLLRDPDLTVALKWRAEAKPNPAWAERYQPALSGEWPDIRSVEKGASVFQAAVAFLDQSCEEAARKKEAERLKKEEEDRRKEEELRRKAEELRRATANARKFGFLFAVAASLLAAAAFFGWKYNKQRKVAHERLQEMAFVTAQAASYLEQLPPNLKNRPDVMNHREKILTDLRETAEQALKEEPSSVKVMTLHVFGQSLLADLHMDKARNADEKKSAHKECEDNIRQADKLAAQANGDVELALSGMLLAASAQTLKWHNELPKAQETALRAQERAEAATKRVSSDDSPSWVLIEASYAQANQVLDKRSPARELGKIFDVINGAAGGKRLSNANNAGQEAFDPRVALLADMRRAMVLEQGLERKEDVRRTYETALWLTESVANRSPANDLSFDKSFWLYIELGDAAVECSILEDADRALDEADKWWKRIKAGHDATYDHFVFLQRRGNVLQTGAQTLQDAAQRYDDVHKALEYHEQTANLYEQLAKDPAGPLSDLAETVEYNLAMDHLLLGEKSEADEHFQKHTELIERDKNDHADESDNAIYSAFMGVIGSYEDVNDYSAARTWDDKALAKLSAFAKDAKDRRERRALRSLISKVYGTRSWLDLFLGDFGSAIRDAQKGLDLDPSQLWILTNEAHGYLFSGHVKTAEQVYLKNAWRKLENEDRSFADAVRQDFKDFEKFNSTQKESEFKLNLKNVERIIEELNAVTQADAEPTGRQ